VRAVQSLLCLGRNQQIISLVRRCPSLSPYPRFCGSPLFPMILYKRRWGKTAELPLSPLFSRMSCHVIKRSRLEVELAFPCAKPFLARPPSLRPFDPGLGSRFFRSTRTYSSSPSRLCALIVSLTSNGAKRPLYPGDT